MIWRQEQNNFFHFCNGTEIFACEEFTLRVVVVLYVLTLELNVTAQLFKYISDLYSLEIIIMHDKCIQ